MPTEDTVITPENVTPEWLTEMLRSGGVLKSAEVISVRRERIGTGLVGQNLRFHLNYNSENTAAPATLVGKFPSPEEQSRRTAKTLRTYEREVRFYLELAGTVDIRVPRCHSGALSEDCERFHLILEDMSPDAPGDQIRGCDLRETAAALDELAGLHAPRWNDPGLDDFEWLARADEESNALLRGMYEGCWDGFVRTYGDRLSAEQCAFGEAFGANLGVWQEGWSSPLCVVHGDFRPDNLMFGSRDGKVSVTTVDWQTTGAAVGAMDAAYFIGNSMFSTDRRTHEMALLERYHSKLVERGVPRYSWEACLEDYRRATLAGIIMSVVASQVVAVDERGKAMFSAMAERHFAHAMDHDAQVFFS
jgi:aminoglycoside/choline kinase family phosphotransferase